MLRVENLEKIYDGNLRALGGISLNLGQSETLAIVGESGCGKSTLAKIIMGLESPSSGQVYFNEKPISNLSQTEISKYVQMVFQDPASSLNPRRKVSEIIMEPLKIQGQHSQEQLRSKMFEAMAQVGLREEMADRYPHMFSGGQKQRVGIARALMTHPKLIICDEPVSALDVSIQAQVLNLLKDLQQRFKLSYLFISHDLHVVRFIADRVAVMYLGKLVELGTREDVFNRPQHPYTKLLLSSTPQIGEIPKETQLKASELPSPRNPPSGCAFHTRCNWQTELCRSKAPDFTGTKGHLAACFHLNDIGKPNVNLEQVISENS